jgi:hypothetical protein
MTVKVLSFSRAVPALAPIVHMFVITFTDMRDFLLVLLVILLGLALSYFVELNYFYDTTQSFHTYSHSIVSTFRIALGEQDPTGDDLTTRTWMSTVLFLVSNIVLPIVLLNLVIARISSTYTKTMKQMAWLEWKGRAEIVIDIYTTRESIYTKQGVTGCTDVVYWTTYSRSWFGIFAIFFTLLLFLFTNVWVWAILSIVMNVIIENSHRNWLKVRSHSAFGRNENGASAGTSQTPSQWLHVLRPEQSKSTGGAKADCEQ